MKDHLRSFFTAYFIIPIIFYLVDMACQSTFVTGNDVSFVILNFALIVCTFIIFQFLLVQKYSPVNSPVAAAIGGIIGLLHFFQYYMIIGTFWVWHTVRFVGFTAAEKKLLWVNLINPFFNYEDMICDGAGPAILVLSIFFLIVAGKKTRPRK